MYVFMYIDICIIRVEVFRIKEINGDLDNYCNFLTFKTFNYCSLISWSLESVDRNNHFKENFTT